MLVSNYNWSYEDLIDIVQTKLVRLDLGMPGHLLGQVPILKRGILHGMPGDLCDCRFNGSMTQLF